MGAAGVSRRADRAALIRRVLREHEGLPMGRELCQLVMLERGFSQYEVAAFGIAAQSVAEVLRDPKRLEEIDASDAALVRLVVEAETDEERVARRRRRTPPSVAPVTILGRRPPRAPQSRWHSYAPVTRLLQVWAGPKPAAKRRVSVSDHLSVPLALGQPPDTGPFCQILLRLSTGRVSQLF
jgi:hypothetical protein